MFMYAKLKLAGAAVLASLLVGGSSVGLLAHVRAGDKKAAPVPAVNDASAVARFKDGMTVECLGIRRIGGKDQWWFPNGSLSQLECDPAGSTNVPPHSHQLTFRVTGAPEGAGIVYRIAP